MTTASTIAMLVMLWSQTAITVHIRPQMRDGFVDVDHGVLDTIKDLAAELKKSKGLQVIGTDDARITIVIVGRRTAGSAGGIGIPSGTTTLFLPIHGRAIDLILKVGSYERAITSEDVDNGTWRAAAMIAAKDINAWIAANREKLSQ